MIHVSDNQAATRCGSIVGDRGLYTVAKAAAMTDFSVSGPWLTALLSPADQARFFFAMDSLIPREFAGYARFLLSTIEASQSWGIPVVARPLGYQTFFKDGSEPTALGQLVHQVDRLEGHGRVFATAVMTDGDPTMQYGIDTIRGVATALLGNSVVIAMLFPGAETATPDTPGEALYFCVAGTLACGHAPEHSEGLRVSKPRRARIFTDRGDRVLMTATAHKPAAFELRRGRESLHRKAAAQRYWLRATEDGWSLLAPSGKILFRGLGEASRRECLEFARAAGVLAVLG